MEALYAMSRMVRSANILKTISQTCNLAKFFVMNEALDCFRNVSVAVSMMPAISS